MKVQIITLYPQIFDSLKQGILGSALKKGLWDLQLHNLRDFATDKHSSVDDTPLGGGAGMVIKPDVAGNALEHALKNSPPNKQLIYTTPSGHIFNQKTAHEILQSSQKEEGDFGLIIFCSRFEGLDKRVMEKYPGLELSIGDFVLCGGEVAAMAMIESILRLKKGVLGNQDSLAQESFSQASNYSLLEHPQYTRPQTWEGKKAPEVLLSGNHKKIQDWQQEQSELTTKKFRPDLWKKYSSS